MKKLSALILLVILIFTLAAPVGATSWGSIKILWSSPGGDDCGGDQPPPQPPPPPPPPPPGGLQWYDWIILLFDI